MKMTSAKIQGWLRYWDNAKMVAVSEIRAFEDVHQARKYCECMRVSVFADVTDLQIWRAIALGWDASHNERRTQWIFQSHKQGTPKA